MTNVNSQMTNVNSLLLRLYEIKSARDASTSPITITQCNGIIAKLQARLKALGVDAPDEPCPFKDMDDEELLRELELGNMNDQGAAFNFDVQEVSEEEMTEMLCALPPEKPHYGESSTSFAMSEMLYDHITYHYVRVGDKCFKFKGSASF